MFRTRTVKIMRDVTSRKTRTLLVSLSVFVGVLVVVVLATLGQLVTRQLEKDLVPREMAMLRIFVEAGSGNVGDPQAALETLRDYPGTTAVEGQAVYEFRWRLPDEADYRAGQLFAFSEPYRQITLEPIRLLEGRYPVEGQGEIAIEQRMADAHGLAVGDTLVIDINGDGEETQRIVGLVYQPYFYIGGGDGTSSAYATYADAQHIVGFNGFSSIYARFDDFPTARQQSHSFRKALMEQTPYRIVFYLVNDPDDNVFLVGVRQFTRVLMILAAVAMTVASVLVTTVITTIVAEQRQQIGAMKALGATRTDILRIYLGMALIYGLIGTIPAVLIGLPLGIEAALKAAPVANTILQDTSPPPMAAILGVVLGLGVPIAAAIVPVYHGSQITIFEAMTDQGIAATYGRGLLPYLVRVLSLPLGLVQALNNVLRYKARLALTLMTLTLSVAAFMGMFAVFQTLNHVVGSIRTTLNYQVSVDPANIEAMDLLQGVFTDMEEHIREMRPGVAVRLQAHLPENGDDPSDDPEDVETRAEDLFVTGIDPSQDLRDLAYEAGTGWQADPARQGIVITPHMADKFDKTVGDTLHLISPENTQDFPIIGIAEFPLETAFMEWEQLAAFVGTIRDAPIPNAYWEQVRVQTRDGEDVPGEIDVWAVGIDARVGQILARGFDPDHHDAIISQSLADAGGFQVGDMITLKPLDGAPLGLDELVDPAAVEYPVAKIVAIKPQELRVVARELPADVLDADSPALVALFWADLAELVHLDYRKFTPETFFIDLSNPQATVNGLNHSYIPPVPVFQNQVGFEDRIAQTLLSLGLIMSMASVLMAVVGGIGLLTITSIGVFERQREIGVLRSVGASSRSILRLFLLEGFLVGVFAWGVGLPLSYLLGTVLIDMVPFSDVITFRYTLLAPIIGLLGMLLVTGLATLYPAIVAARRTVSEILQYQ